MIPEEPEGALSHDYDMLEDMLGPPDQFDEMPADFEPDPELVAAMDQAMANMDGAPKAGRIPLSADQIYNYSEADARELSEFDIMAWLAEKGLGGDFDPKNRELLLLALEEKYCLPKMQEVN